MKSKLPLQYWLLLVGVLLLVTWFGARRLNSDGVWFDEWWSLYDAGASYFGAPKSPLEIWNQLAASDVTEMPVYTLTLAAWGNTVGWTEYTARALSLLAGVFAVAVVFRLGWLISGKRLVGLGAAVTMGSSVWFIYYLHEIRRYTFFALLVALFLLLYVRIMHTRRPASPLLYVCFLLATAGLLYAHPFASIFVGVIGVWHCANGVRLQLLRERPTPKWWMTLGMALLAGVLLLPWANVFLNGLQFMQARARIPILQNVEPISLTSELLTIFSNASVGLFLVLAFFSLREKKARWLWLLFAVVWALNMVAYRLILTNELRMSIDLLPVLALIAGFGVYQLAKLRVPPALVLSLWIASAVLVEGNFELTRLIQRTPPQPIREMAQALTPYLSEGDVMLNVVGEGGVSAMHQHPIEQYFGSLPGREEIVEMETQPSVQAYVQSLQQKVGDAQRIWLTYSPQWISTEWSLMMYMFDQWNIYRCTTLVDNADMRIMGFGRIDPNTPAWTFDGIEGRIIGTPLVNGDRLDVWTGFSVAPDVPPDTYSFGLHLLDSTGTLRAQFDAGVPNGVGCQLAQMSMAGLPAGEYSIHLLIYNWRTGERLIGTAPNGTTGDSLAVATVER